MLNRKVQNIVDFIEDVIRHDLGTTLVQVDNIRVVAQKGGIVYDEDDPRYVDGEYDNYYTVTLLNMALDPVEALKEGWRFVVIYAQAEHRFMIVDFARLDQKIHFIYDKLEILFTGVLNMLLGHPANEIREDK